MVEKTIKECDNCGKQSKPLDVGTDTPPKWFRLVKIKIYYRLTRKGESDHEINNLEIDSRDPDFCCKKCVMVWFEKELDKLMKQPIKK